MMADPTLHNGFNSDTTDLEIQRAELGLIGWLMLDADLSLQAVEHFTVTEADFQASDRAKLFGVLYRALLNGEPADHATVGFHAPELRTLALDAMTGATDQLNYASAHQCAARLRQETNRRTMLFNVQRVAQIAAQDPEAAAGLMGQIAAEWRPTEEEPEGADPLAASSDKPLRLGWVDEYAKLMTDLTGSPSEFNRLCGLVTAAAAIQRRAVLRMAFGNIYPNIYAAIVARSSVYHKSSALAKPRAILQRAELDKLLLSELMTSEGLLAQLQNQPSGLIIRDEIGTLFSSQNTKYLIQLKPDLTALYDGQPYSRRLSSHDIRVDRPYLNILGATTPTRFYEGVTHTDWHDGFLARWLFVLPEGDPKFGQRTGMLTPAHDVEMGRLATTLQNINRQRDTDFAFGGNAYPLWFDWQDQAARNAFLFGDDSISAIVTRYSTYALKFAIILSAVNDAWGTITEETMQTAIDLADTYKASVHKLLAGKQSHGMSGARLQKVFKQIKRRGGAAGVTRKAIMQYTRMRAGDVTQCIEKLLEIGAITEDNSGRSPRYTTTVETLPLRIWR